ncbi:hypothetical protein ACFSCX_19025 [Bacillus salitolerans]|uniref:Secreted protein n=1 Tax=Bacillus salitolerans TaxID=1437434 RepID=A0ABW4LTX8_9BACI
MNKSPKLFTHFSILILCMLAFPLNNIVIANEGTSDKKDLCEKYIEEEWETVNEKVLKDIIKSFELDLTGYKEIERSDLNMNIGDNIIGHYDKITLEHLFVGASNGDMRLFLKNGLSGNEGYFLYKRPDGINVLKNLSKIGDVWVVMNVSEKKGNEYNYNLHFEYICD